MLPGCIRAARGGALSLALLAPPLAAAEPAPEPAPEPAAEVRAAPQRADLRGRGRPLTWAPAWRRFGVADTIVTSSAAALAVTSLVVGPTGTATSDPELGVDASVREALRADDFTWGQAWRDTSDVLLTLNVSYPYLGDALVNAAWYRGSPAVGRELALIDSEAFAVTLGLQQAFANFVGRQRPYGVTCGTDELPEATAACTVHDRYRSYFSGHTSLSFTAAALTCTHHRHLALHGGRAEWTPCAVGVLLATGTGTLRIAGDRHYFTDVVTGAAVGSLVGWLVPLTHYRIAPRRRRAGAHGLPTLSLVPVPGGLGLGGQL